MNLDGSCITLYKIAQAPRCKRHLAVVYALQYQHIQYDPVCQLLIPISIEVLKMFILPLCLYPSDYSNQVSVDKVNFIMQANESAMLGGIPYLLQYVTGIRVIISKPEYAIVSM